MTDLHNGQITDLLNNSMRYNPETISIGYAILQEKRRIMDMVSRTRTMSVIDLLREDVLDLLAVELRSPYYTEDLPIAKKREIIKNTLIWFSKAGTPAALEELIYVLFGEGEIVEWFDFTDPPYTPGTFDIITDTRMTEDIVDQFLQIIRRVKNTRSHLRRVLVERTGTMQEYIGAGMVAAPKTNVLNGGLDIGREVDAPQKVKAGAITAPKERIVNYSPARGQAIDTAVTAKAVAAAAPTNRITNQAPEQNWSAAGAVAAGAGAASAPSERIVNNAPARAEAARGTFHLGAALAVRGVHVIISNCTPPGALQVGQVQRTCAAAAASSNIKI